MLATIILAAETAASHADHTPFYVAGGLLAAWAIAVGALGVLRPAVTDGDVSHRVIMGGTIVLAAVTLALAVATGS